MNTLLLVSAALLAASIQSIAAPKIGAPAPDFTLLDTQGRTRSLADFRGKHVVLEWVNHGCPFVQKHYGSGNMQSLQKFAADKDVAWLSICSSAPGKQGHMSAEEWNKTFQEKKTAATAVLLDPEGKVGRAYDAKTTPQMFIINPEGKLIYAGGIDDKPTTNQADIVGATNYVKTAIEEALGGKPITNPETKPYGCSVKF